MTKTRTSAVVIGRLIVMGVLLVIRWTLWPFYGLFLILFTLFESLVNGIAFLIDYLKTLNNELLKGNQ